MSDFSVSLGRFPPAEKGHTAHVQVLQSAVYVLLEYRQTKDTTAKGLAHGHSCSRCRAGIRTEVSYLNGSCLAVMFQWELMTRGLTMGVGEVVSDRIQAEQL